ncbi:MAG: acetolactate synthase small subunit [Thaumarchaeota archaeon S14]|nr:MAG: acetolactate synthase small subunit [Thaumarchaeota archaeon S14]
MAILSIKVENRPGILWKVTHLFRSRNFNIESISVGPTEDPEFSRMTISVRGQDERQVAQMIKQLNKLIDTVEVTLLDEHKTVYRELAIFKIRLSGAQDSMEVNKLAGAYGGKVQSPATGLAPSSPTPPRRPSARRARRPAWACG